MLTSIAIILLLGMFMGWLFSKIKLPSLLGMIITGILLGPHALNIIDSSILSISSDLRQIALVIILTRAGLSLNISDLKKVGRPAFLMCFVPACIEILGTIIFAPLLLGVTILDAAIIGSVIAAVSPAVVVPRMISLIENGYGVEKGIPQLILAGASVDDVFVIIILKVTNIKYEVYEDGSQLLSYLLTPSTVCLAIPLYQQMGLLKKNMKAILAGILSGVFTSLAGVWVFSTLFHLDKQIYATLLPKSITTAIGMGISEELGGIVTITVAAIIITGIIGNMFGDVICRLCGIRHPIATGLAIGTATHAMGTAKAMEIGEIEGAMSSLSIAVAGLITVVGSTIFYQLY